MFTIFWPTSDLETTFVSGRAWVDFTFVKGSVPGLNQVCFTFNFFVHVYIVLCDHFTLYVLVFHKNIS